MVVLGGVAAWRLVAAADMAAFLAHAKVHPVMLPGGHALHAAWSRRRDVMDVVEVPAGEFEPTGKRQPRGRSARRDTRLSRQHVRC